MIWMRRPVLPTPQSSAPIRYAPNVRAVHPADAHPLLQKNCLRMAGAALPGEVRFDVRSRHLRGSGSALRPAAFGGVLTADPLPVGQPPGQASMTTHLSARALS